MASEKEVTKIKDQIAFKLLDQPEVSGVGVEKDDKDGYVLAIHLNTDDPEIRKRLAVQIKGAPVKFLSSGPYRKQAAKKEK